MTLKHNRSIQRGKPNSNVQVEGSNWVFIAGGVLLSTLTIRLGCKLKHVFDKKQQNTPIKGLLIFFLLCFCFCPLENSELVIVTFVSLLLCELLFPQNLGVLSFDISYHTALWTV